MCDAKRIAIRRRAPFVHAASDPLKCSSAAYISCCQHALVVLMNFDESCTR